MAKVVSGVEPLTGREADVLACLADGLSNSEIAERLFLSPSTVKWYVRQLNSKLDTTNRDEIIERARAAGLLDTPEDGFAPIKHNLPHQTTPFTGRDAELEELAHLLKSPAVRMVTILAPGGMGKTRLALESAEQQLYNFPDGVYFVPLQSLGEVDQIIPAVAQYIGFQFAQDEWSLKQQLFDYLRGKTMLLVVDNWEHLLDGAPLISDILHTSPGLKVLATSREKLNLSGETVYVLRGMHFPTLETPEDALSYDAVKLLVQAAKRVRPDFAVTQDNLDSVTRVCRLTEGMPMGILLATSWLDVFSLERIAEEIQRNVDFLETEMRDIPERQRSIRAIFESTWEQLTSDAQQVFMKLTVFRGGCTPEAAQTVAGAVPRILQTLVNKALVLCTEAGRYDIHELLRQYGYARLEASGQFAETMRQYSLYYARFLYEREEDLKGRRQLAALNEIEAELDNIRQAWYLALDDEDIDRIEQASFSLLRYAYSRSRQVELMPLFADAEAALRSGFATHQNYGRLLAYLGGITGSLARFQEGERFLREAWTIAQVHEDAKGMAYSSAELAKMLFAQRKLDEAWELVEESIRICEMTGDQWNLAHALNSKGYELLVSGKVKEGLDLCRQALDIERELGDEIWMANALTSIAAGMFEMGRYKELEALIREALALRKRLNQPLGIALSVNQLMVWEFHKGSIETARQYAEELLQIGRKYEFSGYSASAFIILSFIDIASDQFDEAEQRQKEAMRLTDSKVHSPHLISKGFVQLARRNWVGARTALIQFSKPLVGNNAADLLWFSILGIGLVIAEEGQIEHGLEVASLALNDDFHMPKPFANCPLVARHLESIKSKLGEAAYAATWERGRALDFDATVAELVAAYEKDIPTSS